MAKLLPKDELQRQLGIIAKQEQKEFIKNNHQDLVDRFVGKFFKQEQSWGGSSPKIWYKYTKVLGIKPDDVYVIQENVPTAHCSVYSFQQDILGNVSFDMSNKTQVHNLGKEISEDQFNKEWNRIMDVLNNLG